MSSLIRISQTPMYGSFSKETFVTRVTFAQNISLQVDVYFVNNLEVASKNNSCKFQKMNSIAFCK
jgi:hypothetical protein